MRLICRESPEVKLLLKLLLQQLPFVFRRSDRRVLLCGRKKKTKHPAGVRGRWSVGRTCGATTRWAVNAIKKICHSEMWPNISEFSPFFSSPLAPLFTKCLLSALCDVTRGRRRLFRLSDPTLGPLGTPSFLYSCPFQTCCSVVVCFF